MTMRSFIQLGKMQLPFQENRESKHVCSARASVQTELRPVFLIAADAVAVAVAAPVMPMLSCNVLSVGRMFRSNSQLPTCPNPTGSATHR